MNILISNDDGIHSEGIYRLTEALKTIATVVVVAPLTEQSAAGHSITMKTPLRVKEIERNGSFFGYAVNGTPADCVKLGIRNLLGFTPDLVVSGINNGANTATNVVYSGTVSAAREGAILGVPGIAVSIASHTPRFYDAACDAAIRFSLLVKEKGLPSGTILNINVPDCSPGDIAGTLITRQGSSKWDDSYEERTDPYGAKYYWLVGRLTNTDTSNDYDHYAVLNNYISVSPIHFDLSDSAAMDLMNNWNIR